MNTIEERIELTLRSIERNKNQKKYWKTHVPIYHTNDMEREMRDEDLYTKEELMNPPEEETGRINWEYWNKLVSEVKKNSSKLIFFQSSVYLYRNAQNL